MCPRALLSLTLACTLVTVYASGPSIGLATAEGSFQINSAVVRGNGTLFDGSTIETLKAPSQVNLNNGARLRLATETRARVYQDRLVLEQGGSQLSSSGYTVEARSLRIQATSADAVARVHLNQGSPVLVAAMKGSVQVRNSAGVLVAKLAAGDALTFEPQAGATGPTKISGCLLLKDGKFIVVDQTTKVEVQVQGVGLQKEVGNRVEITGAADPAQVVTVQQIKRLGKGGCAATAKAIGAGPGAPAGGISTTTVAIIGGVAVVGAVGGMAAAGTFSGSQSPTPTSR